jgi:AI-2 transport protein TqsA
VRVLIGAASLVIIVAGLRAGAALLIPLVFALFLAVLSYPSVQTLQKRGVPGVAAVGLTVLAVLGLLAGPGLLVVAAVREFVSAAPGCRKAKTSTRRSCRASWIRPAHSTPWPTRPPGW